MSLATPKYSIFTHSVGYHTANHTLLSKLDSIASAGLHGVEIFTDDLWQFAQSEQFAAIRSSAHPEALLTPPDSPLSQPSSLGSSQPKPHTHHQHTFYSAFGECTKAEAQLELAAAEYIRSYCQRLGLDIFCLQPLRDVEGWVSAVDRHVAMQRVRSRFPIMQALDTNLLLICSQNTPSPATTGDTATLVADFQHLSDLASSFTHTTNHVIKIGFEALSWGTHIDLWHQAWNIVNRTNRANIGLILDSFNTLARQFATPTHPTFIQQPAHLTLSNLESNLSQLTHLVPAHKIFLLQIGDAKKLAQPLPHSPNRHEPRPCRLIWSRSSRLFPCEVEKGAFLPVQDFVRAVVNTGYTGPWSVEVFNDSLMDTHSSVPIQHATRARAGLDRLVESIYS